MSFNSLPVAVGVTGHRNIVEDDKPAIKKEVKKALAEIIARNTAPLIMLNSLAQGADILCAEAAFELNIPVTAVLPCEKEKYILSFDEGEKQNFLHCHERAAQTLIAPDLEKSFEKFNADGQLITPESYEYRQAGIYLAEHSQVLIALWDGKPPKVKYGCGTVEVIDFARAKGKEVIWIKCRRQGDGK